MDYDKLNLVKKEIMLKDEHYKNLLDFYTKTTWFSRFSENIKLNDSESVELVFTGDISKKVVHIRINLIDNKTEKIIMVKNFCDIDELKKMTYISFTFKDIFYVFSLYTGCNDIYFNDNFCVTECSMSKKIFILYCFLKNYTIFDLSNLNNFALFICSNIEDISAYEAERILQKIEYFGFEEITESYKYQLLGYEINKATTRLMSFLIYCLKCIINKRNNIYDSYHIYKIAYNIAFPK